MLDDWWMNRTDVKMADRWEVKSAVLSAVRLVGMLADPLESMLVDVTVATRAELLADEMVRLLVGLTVAQLADLKV